MVLSSARNLAPRHALWAAKLLIGRGPRGECAGLGRSVRQSDRPRQSRGVSQGSNRCLVPPQLASHPCIFSPGKGRVGGFCLLFETLFKDGLSLVTSD